MGTSVDICAIDFKKSSQDQTKDTCKSGLQFCVRVGAVEETGPWKRFKGPISGLEPQLW